jgi:hypothetical protein
MRRWWTGNDEISARRTAHTGQIVLIGFVPATRVVKEGSGCRAEGCRKRCVLLGRGSIETSEPVIARPLLPGSPQRRPKGLPDPPVDSTATALPPSFMSLYRPFSSR